MSKSIFHSGKMFSSPGQLGETIPLLSQILFNRRTAKLYAKACGSAGLSHPLAWGKLRVMPKQTIRDLLEYFREEARNKRDLGDKFERLIAAYLTKDPYYATHFSNVWLWLE